MKLGKGQFTTDLCLQFRDGHEWVVMLPLSYIDSYGIEFRVPPGFVTDLASIPRVLWPLLPTTGKYDPAATLHDWMYTTEHNRYLCDWVFLDAMLSSRVNPVIAWAMYAAVRAFGWAARRKRR